MSKKDLPRTSGSADSTTPSPRETQPASVSSRPDFVGESFGDFRILKPLGQGGMGTVYLAEQVSLKRKVAIKVLREDVAADAKALERFKAESKTVAQLSHANIVQVHAFGEHQGRPYMVLEYVEGKNLREYLMRQGPLDVPLVLSIMRQVAGALHRAGELGIIHRDIKPENILLTRKGEAKVADFGLSRCGLALDQPVDLTRAGTTVGTPLFMSPEQVEGKAVDQRSDLYSFGVTCYQMLTGSTPFTGSNAFAIALKHVREEPAPLASLRPDLPPALCAIVHKMMAKKRRDRYQSARDLLKDVAKVRESLGGTTGVVPARAATETMPAGPTARGKPAPLWKWRGSRLWIPVLAGAAGLAVFAAVLVGVAVAWRPQPPAHADAVPAPTTAPDAPPAPPVPAAPAATPPSPPSGVDGSAEREQSLKRLVEQHLNENLPNPEGVEDCIDLGVLYLDQNKTSEAEALFARMDERRPPSAYHFVGRLGLAVTDALKNNHRASHDKLTELFDAKARDNRAQILNDYLAKKPELAKWVNEADSQNVRNGVTESPVPKGWPHFPDHGPFRRP